MNRDNFTCQYCWLVAWNWVQLQVDHKVSVKSGWQNTIDNLITSCFECNIGKGKKNVDEVRRNIYETKISDMIWLQMIIFYDWWNIRNLWNIDNNTKALLKILYGNYLWWEKYLQYINYVWPVFLWIKLNSLNSDKKSELLNMFREWWDFCDFLLKYIESPFYTTLIKDNNSTLDEYFINSLLNDDIWQGICEDSYNNRLNYLLTEELIEVYNDWLLKNDYSIKKFSYFFKEVVWHKE